jgi:hypothetical protein
MIEHPQTDAAKRVAEALYTGLLSESVSDDHGNKATIVDVVSDVARAIHVLGNADASTPMGALEAHGAAMIEASENVSRGLYDIADAIREITS